MLYLITPPMQWHIKGTRVQQLCREPGRRCGKRGWGSFLVSPLGDSSSSLLRPVEQGMCFTFEGCLGFQSASGRLRIRQAGVCARTRACVGVRHFSPEILSVM